MRRQFGTGGATAGASRNARLDPHSLPLRFDAGDARADGGLRHIEITRDSVVLRRAVRGMRMAINVRVHDFLGLAVRTTEDGHVLVLVHRDPSLTVPLTAANDHDEIMGAAQDWSAALARPLLDEAIPDASAPRRRRHNVIRTRRPKILMRRRGGGTIATMAVYRDEREIIART